MLKIDTLDYAERFVVKQQKSGKDVRWDNYDIVFFRPAPWGASSKNGAYRHGQWGFENRYEVDGNGEWNIDWRDVRDVRPDRRVGN